ncbi:MAG TPA: glycosyltransferase family 4 protein [Flavobacteriales bacterium]|nr:glycosyltransferase family 4 protein [Flavobacteriales bacterium]
MARPLNIAHCVESYAPALGGMPEVVKQLSERLVRMGHRVTVFTSHHDQRDYTEHNGVRIRSYQLSGNAVNGIVGDPAPYLSDLKQGHFDVTTFFAAQQWSADAVLPHLDELTAKKVFVPTGFSSLHDPRYAAYYAEMPKWLAGMDLNVFLSHRYRDIDMARANGLSNHTVIPNGAAAEEFDEQAVMDMRAELAIGPKQSLLLHLGSYTGIKGHKEAIRIFLAANTGHAVLVLAGNGNLHLKHFFEHHWRYFTLRWSAQLKKKRIVFIEPDRARTVALMKQADLFLFPSQVECSPIVLFESMAAGVPFLASQAGNSQEITEWSNGGWTIPGSTDANERQHVDVRAGAKLLSALIAEPERLHSVGQAGRDAWKKQFTWQRIAEQYAEQYQLLVGHG